MSSYKAPSRCADHPPFSEVGDKSLQLLPSVDLDGNLPQFVRLPKPGKRCRWTGLARSALNDLILGKDPPVRSVVVARTGASRGIRLVHLGSLLKHLNGLMEQQNNGEEGVDE